MLPLWVLWAINGVPLVPAPLSTAAAVVLAVLPLLILGARIRIAERRRDRYTLVGRAGRSGVVERSGRVFLTGVDRSVDTLAYMLAMVLPFYAIGGESWRDLASTLVAVFLVAVVFYSLDLYYLNIVLLLAGYRMYAVDPGEEISERAIVLSRARDVAAGQSVLRITDQLYLAKGLPS